MSVGNIFRIINLKTPLKLGIKDINVTPDYTNNAYISNNFSKSSLDNLKANYLISFTSLNKQKKDMASFDPGDCKDIINLFNPKARKIFEDAIANAMLNMNKEVDPLHLTWSIIDDAQTCLKKERETEFHGLLKLINKDHSDLLSNENGFDELNQIFNILKVFIEEKIEELPKITDGSGKLTVSKDLQKILETSIDNAKKACKTEQDLLINDTLLLASIFDQNQMSTSKQVFLDLMIDLKTAEDEILAGSDFSIPPDFIENSLNEKVGDNPLLNKSFIRNLSILPDSDLIGLDFYNHQVDLIANIITSGNNVIFTSDNGILPALLAHSFMKKVNSDNTPGLTNYNTEIELLDVNKAEALGKKGLDIVETISERAHNNPEKKYILFVKDFDRLAIEYILNSKVNAKHDPSLAFKKSNLPANLTLVGFMPDNIYTKFTDIKSASQINDIQLSETFRNNFEKVPINVPSPSKTKEILKAEPRILASSISNFKENIEITNEALDKIVDFSVKIRRGTLPNKAIDLCNFVIASKLLNSQEAQQMYKITLSDVNKFIVDYPDFRQSQESTNGKFSLIYDTGITFKDVGGASQAKEILSELLDFIKNPSKYSKAGAKMPKGVLMSGPPGNGKTHLGKALAGEADVPFISTSGSTFVEQFVGVGAQRVRELFNFARDMARSHEKKTAIIFIDEFDSLGKKRSGTGNAGSNESEQTLNELLVQMDGLNNDSDVNVIVIGATNRKDLLDSAVTRPGRFDNVVVLPNPSRDPQARYEILKIHARKLKLKGNREKILRELADRTASLSAAQLADLLNKAAIKVARNNRVNITINDLIEAKLEVISGRIHNDDNPLWFKEILVAHECGHALVRQIFLDIAKHAYHKPNEIDTITLDGRASAAGAVYSKPGENVMDSFESIFAEIASKYGGHAVEKLIFGISGSYGISSDLENATSLINTSVTQMGMGPNMELISPNGDKNILAMFNLEHKNDLKLFSKQTAKAAQLIVDFHRDFIHQYMDIYKQRAGKGGNNLSGEEFKTRLLEWRSSHPELEKKYEDLVDTIGVIIENTKNGVDSAIRRTVFLP